MEENETINMNVILKRNLVWDILPCPTQAAAISKFGMLPGSEGGNNREHSRSHARLDRIVPVSGVIQLISEMASEIAGTSILESQGIDVDDYLGKNYMQLFSKIAKAASLATVANLLDQGMIHIVGEASQ